MLTGNLDGGPYDFQQESDLYYMAAYAGYKYIG